MAFLQSSTLRAFSRPCPGSSGTGRPRHEAGSDDFFFKEGRGIFSPWATGDRAGRKKTCTLCHVNIDCLVQEDNIGSVGTEVAMGRKPEQASWLLSQKDSSSFIFETVQP